MLPLSNFLLVWPIVALNTTTPGPNVVNTIATAMSAGRRAGLGAAMGVAIGVALWCLASSLASSLGFAAIFVTYPRAEQVMAVVAAGLMTWLAVRALRFSWRGYRRAQRGLPQAPAALSYGAALARAVMISATNPKVLTTWLSIATLFPVARAGIADVRFWPGAPRVSDCFSTAPTRRFFPPARWYDSICGRDGRFIWCRACFLRCWPQAWFRALSCIDSALLWRSGSI